jgi:hypothetical protein
VVGSSVGTLVLREEARWLCGQNHPALVRKFVISRNDGAPNERLYSRLNWEGLS